MMALWKSLGRCPAYTIAEKKRGRQVMPAAPMFGQIPRLHSEVESHGVSGAVVDRVQHLFGEATMRFVDGIVDVLPLDEHIEVLANVVAGAEVNLSVGIDERGSPAERAGILLLAEVIQVLAAPGHRDARMEAPLLEEADEVGRVRKTGDGEAALSDVVRIVRVVGADECRVRLHAEARVPQHVLRADLHTAPLRRRSVDLRRNAERRQRTSL